MADRLNSLDDMVILRNHVDIVVLVLPLDDGLNRRLLLEVLHVLPEVEAVHLNLFLLVCFPRLLEVCFQFLVVFYEVFLPLDVLVDLLIEILPHFELLTQTRLYFEDNKGTSDLHACGCTRRYFSLPLAKHKSSKLGLLVLEPELAVSVVYLAVVARNTDIADLQIAVLSPSDRVETFEVDEVPRFGVQNVHHPGRFNFVVKRL